MSLHADALGLLEGWRPDDAGQEEQRRRYVAHLREHPDGLGRACYPDHLTASTLVLSADGRSTLLTLHAKAGRWFQLGGHCEDDDTTLLGAARREATEESGIAGLVLDPLPVHLSAHDVPFCDPRGGARHLDVRFVAVAPAGAPAEASEESLDLRWWPVDDLPDPDPGMVELVAVARARLGQRDSRPTGPHVRAVGGLVPSRPRGPAAGRPRWRPTSPAGSPWPARPGGSGRPRTRSGRRGRAAAGGRARARSRSPRPRSACPAAAS